MFKQVVFVTAAILGGTAIAQAASSTSPQEACKTDISILCAGLERGEGRVMKCLKENREKLSEGCKTALRSKQQQGKSNTKSSGSTDSNVFTQ